VAISVSDRNSKHEQAGLPPTLRAARRRDRRSLGQFRSFLVEMQSGAPSYKRKYNINARKQAVAPDVVLEIWLRPPSRRQRNGNSCYTGRRVFGALSITGSLIRRWIGAARLGHSGD
jgi:hypothetical protein